MDNADATEFLVVRHGRSVADVDERTGIQWWELIGDIRRAVSSSRRVHLEQDGAIR